jgi:crotonobetainyl-CoA:carnitine CoA-transferase CaiB-like acyl-CoA transferase
MSASPKRGVHPAALAGLKVLDLSRFIAGPYCGLMLGDLGADVVKVESIGKGDNTRSFTPRFGDESLYTIAMNRNKRSMELNFRDPDGQAVLRKLMAEADIVIENFVPGTLEKMGCGWDEMSRINPRLIMARISGFGQSGPFAQRPCFDIIGQAMSGLMDLTGQPDGPPTGAGVFVVDFTTALYATIGVLGALQSRNSTGKGQMVECALLNSAVSMLLTSIPDFLLNGTQVTREGSRDRFNAPGNTFPTADGAWVILITVGDDKFERLTQVMDRPDLLADPRFATNEARLVHRDEIEAEVSDWTRSLETADLLACVEAAGIPCAKVATIADVVENPHLRETGHIIELDQPSGKVPVQGFPYQLHGSPLAVHRRAPLLGEHTDEILADWAGLSTEDVDRLRKSRVV